jgi:hypothetical protein
LPWAIAFLVCMLATKSFAQTPDSLNRYRDTVYIYESEMESVVTYSARDSIFTDLRNNKVHLFGNASLNYQGVDMKAEYLLIDMDKSEVLATFVLDSLGNRIGEPVFADNGDTIRAATLRYNFETKKGYIQEVSIKQDEFYLTMEKAKRHANEEVHFVHGKLTTCNLEEPHYHFALSKAVLIPEKRIVTGPMNLWIMGVPTPLGLPFSIIPQKKDNERKAGFIMPQIAAFSPYGMGLQDLGYYIPVSDRFQTTIYGTLFSRGTFGFRDFSEYAKRYKYAGNFEVSYNFLREGFPSSDQLENTIVRWTHTQDPKANPYWKFSSQVNYSSQSNNKPVINQQTADYFNNNLNSDIRIDRFFPGTPVQMSLRTSLRQNANNPTVSLVAPVYNLTTTRFFPFKRKNANDGRTLFYETIGMTYNLEAKNQADFAAAYLKSGDFASIGKDFRNGATHTAVITTTINMLNNVLRFTPSITYNQKYNFQSIRKTLNTATNQAVIDSLNEGVFSQNLVFSAGLTTNFYSYYRFIGRRQTLLRHVATPSVTLSASPNTQGGLDSYFDTLGRKINYSRLENSVYAERYLQNAGRIDFALSNTFEIKQRDARDTVTGFRKIQIVENLNFVTSYDIFKDSMNWSDLNIRMTVHPINPLNIVFSGNFSWYGWDRTTGLQQSSYAIGNDQGLGRFSNFSVASTYTLLPKDKRDAIPPVSTMSTVWNPQYQQWLLTPTQIIDFRIPWQISFNHILAYNLATDSATYNDRRYVPNHTMGITGDVSITQNWKINFTTFLDLTNKSVANTRIDLYRNLHCWNMGFNWTPIGTNKSFLISIRGNGSALSNAFFNLRRPQSLFSN